MKSEKELQWLEVGYQMVALNGFNSLNIESIARKLNKNKSSFYHYFGDLELFEAELLEMHTQKAIPFAEELKACEKIKPDAMNVFVEHKMDLLFHKQLRINRENPTHKMCFEKAYNSTEAVFIEKWSDFLGLNEQQFFAQTFLQLVSENFLLQITENTINLSWLNNYLEEIQNLLNRLNR